METKERNARVVELLTRRDEITVEIETIEHRLPELRRDQQEIGTQLAELLGVKAEPGNGEKKPRVCSHCQQPGHTKATCPKLKEPA